MAELLIRAKEHWMDALTPEEVSALPDMHWMETTDNTLLNLELSAAVQVSGLLIYTQEA